MEGWKWEERKEEWREGGREGGKEEANRFFWACACSLPWPGVSETPSGARPRVSVGSSKLKCLFAIQECNTYLYFGFFTQFLKNI